MISISGVFAVTFSVVFAYVADVTTTEDRSKAYGLVSATFAASLVSSKLLCFVEFSVCACVFYNSQILLRLFRSYLRHLESIYAKFIAIH